MLGEGTAAFLEQEMYVARCDAQHLGDRGGAQTPVADIALDLAQHRGMAHRPQAALLRQLQVIALGADGHADQVDEMLAEDPRFLLVAQGVGALQPIERSPSRRRAWRLSISSLPSSA